MIDIKNSDDGIIFCIKVIPGSSKSAFSAVEDGVLKIKLNSPPVDGRANAECINLLSKTFRVAKSSIVILSGERSKQKRIKISGDVKNIISKLEEIASSLE